MTTETPEIPETPETRRCEDCRYAPEHWSPSQCRDRRAIAAYAALAVLIEAAEAGEGA